MCNGQNGHRHLGALHILYQQQPTDLDRRFIEIRQWLTAEGEYSDLIVEQGLLQDGELWTGIHPRPVRYVRQVTGVHSVGDDAL
jgi:hypothetical protein